MRRCVPACVNMGVRMWVVRACVLCACGRQRVPVRGRVECVHTGVCECETVDRPCACGGVGVRCGDSAAPFPRAPGQSGARRHRRGLLAAPPPAAPSRAVGDARAAGCGDWHRWSPRHPGRPRLGAQEPATACTPRRGPGDVRSLTAAPRREPRTDVRLTAARGPRPRLPAQEQMRLLIEHRAVCQLCGLSLARCSLLGLRG